MKTFVIIFNLGCYSHMTLNMSVEAQTQVRFVLTCQAKTVKKFLHLFLVKESSMGLERQDGERNIIFG